jgi:U32 family peptidase
MPVKIISPLSTIDEVEPLIQAGAGEFYCGVLPDDWRENYSVAASLNRRQEDTPVINTSPHFKSFEELDQAVAAAHRSGVPVFLTLNEHYYSSAQYPYLIKYIERALASNADAIIAGDIGIIQTILDMNQRIKIHISTAGTAFNSSAVHFYRDLGASRVILPRHLSLEEIGEIAANTTGIELETFILNSRCANVDGFCTFQHGLAEFAPEGEDRRDYENACMMLYKISASVKGLSDTEAADVLREKISWERQHFWSACHIDDQPCGACSLYEFEEMGIAGVKIVGRGNLTQRKLRDVGFLQEALDYLYKQKPTRKQFRALVQNLYKKLYNSPCLIFKCYYPSVLLDKTAQEV